MYNNLVKKLLKKHEEKIKYLIIGFWNTIFGISCFIGLYYLLNKFIYYQIIVVVSYIIGITNNYICYKLFVFKTKGSYLREYFRFYLVYVPALLINLGLLYIAVQQFKAKVVFAQVIITLIIIIISYLGHKYFTFKPPSTQLKK